MRDDQTTAAHRDADIRRAEEAARAAVASVLEESFQRYEARVAKARAQEDARERQRDGAIGSASDRHRTPLHPQPASPSAWTAHPRRAGTEVPDPSVPRLPSRGRVATVFDAIELTQRLRNRRATGYLHLDSGTSLVFIEGAPCSIHGIHATAALLDLLADRGLVSGLTASSVRAELLPDRPEILLRRLAEDSSVDPSQAWSAYEKVLDHAIGALLNHIGEWSFEDERPAFLDLGGLQLPAEDVRSRLMKLVPRSVPLPRLLEALGGTDVRIRIAQWPAELASARHSGFLGMLDGRTTFGDAQIASGLPREESASLAVLLLALGYGVREGYAPIQGRGFESAWHPYTIDTPPFPEARPSHDPRVRVSEPPLNAPPSSVRPWPPKARVSKAAPVEPPPPEPVAPPPMPPTALPALTAYPQAYAQPYPSQMPAWPPVPTYAPSMWPGYQYSGYPAPYPQPYPQMVPSMLPPIGWPPQPTYAPPTMQPMPSMLLPAPPTPMFVPHGAPGANSGWMGPQSPAPPPIVAPPSPPVPTGRWVQDPEPQAVSLPPARRSDDVRSNGGPDLGAALIALRRRIRSADYFEMLGVEPTASADQIEAAHAELTKPLASAMFRDRPYLAVMASEVCSALDEALAVLRVPELRDAYRRNLTR